HMNLQSTSRVWVNKINSAYEVPYTNIICCVASQYTGPNGGGYASEHEVGKVTGLTFDRFIAVDFKAFRDMVDALGGVDVCLSTNLDDNSYPNYSNGYKPIHFKAGCQHLNGEQALEIARSRHAVQPEQSSDFGRARRQQDIMEAIKKKATTVNGFAKAPQLLSALQKNIHTDMSLSDMKAIYDWGKNLPDSSIIRIALTAPSGTAAGNLLDTYDCGMGAGVSQLCPRTAKWLQNFFGGTVVAQHRATPLPREVSRPMAWSWCSVTTSPYAGWASEHLSEADLLARFRSGDVRALARTITLVERRDP